MRSAKAKGQDRYLELICQFPLRPLRSEKDLSAAIRQLDLLLDKERRDADEEDYLQVLSDLVARFEQGHDPIPGSSDAEILRHLIEAKATTQAATAKKCHIPESTISEVLAGKRKLNRAQIGRVSHYFSVSPEVFSFAE